MQLLESWLFEKARSGKANGLKTWPNDNTGVKECEKPPMLAVTKFISYMAVNCAFDVLRAREWIPKCISVFKSVFSSVY